MSLDSIRWHEASRIMRRMELFRVQVGVFLVVYYLFAIMNVLLEGISLVALMGLLTGDRNVPFLDNIN